MENELIYKIFRTYKEIRLSSTHSVEISVITQPCFEQVNSFKNWTDAINWRKENQNFENEYTIVPCY